MCVIWKRETCCVRGSSERGGGASATLLPGPPAGPLLPFFQTHHVQVLPARVPEPQPDVAGPHAAPLVQVAVPPDVLFEDGFDVGQPLGESVVLDCKVCVLGCSIITGPVPGAVVIWSGGRARGRRVLFSVCGWVWAVMRRAKSCPLSSQGATQLPPILCNQVATPIKVQIFSCSPHSDATRLLVGATVYSTGDPSRLLAHVLATLLCLRLL